MCNEPLPRDPAARLMWVTFLISPMMTNLTPWWAPHFPICWRTLDGVRSYWLRLCIIMWVSTSPGEYRYVGFFEVAGGGRVLAPPTTGNGAV